MTVAHSFHGVERHTAGIGDTTRHQQHETCLRQALPQRLDRHDYLAQAPDHLEEYSHERQAPHGTEQRPTPSATHDAERERCVGASNEKEDCSVIYHPEHPLGSRVRKSVVESGCEVQDRHRCGEDADPHDTRGTVGDGAQHQHRRHGENCQEANSVAYAIGDFLAK